MIKKKRYIIIFSGYNQRAVIAFLRTLEKNNISNYLIIAKSQTDDIFQTNYGSKVGFTRSKKELVLEDIISIIKELKECYRFDEFLIAPSTEALNRFVIRYAKVFRDLGAMDYFVDERLYCSLSDKKEFGEMCKNEGIEIPREMNFPTTYNKPFVAKPISYFSESGEILSPVLVNCKDDYDSFVDKFKIKDFYYQEYVNGKSIYLLYYITKTRAIYKFSQENLVQQAEGKSIILAKVSDFHNLDISTKYEKLLLKLNYHGFIMIEIRKDCKNTYMIEANPRFWGPSQLFVDAGYNLFENFLMEYGFLDRLLIREINENAVYYWHNGASLFINGKEPVFFEGFRTMYYNEIDSYTEYDIYRREDTMNLYKSKK